jgi:hypothetical protein
MEVQHDRIKEHSHTIFHKMNPEFIVASTAVSRRKQRSIYRRVLLQDRENFERVEVFQFPQSLAD